MTRALPWLKRPATATPPPCHLPTKQIPRSKRQRLIQTSSDIDEESGRVLKKELNVAAVSAPELPSEDLMNEGLDNDDIYRMVEDEFQDVAKLFTQHLHAAEYQRLRKAAKSQNAAAINSISRFVSIKTPNETRRKVVSIAKKRKHVAAVNGLDGKEKRESGPDENSSDDNGAWFGTALHGLMENPREAVTPLGKISTAAGNIISIKKSRNRKPSYDLLLPSPDLESVAAIAKSEMPHNIDSGNSKGEDDDADDLDAPVRYSLHRLSRQIEAVTQKASYHEMMPETRNTHSELMKSSLRANAKLEDVSTDEITSPSSISARERISKRLEQSTSRQAQEKQEARRRLEVIPMFLP